MYLYVNSNTAYLVSPKAYSRITGFYYFQSYPSIHHALTTNLSFLIEYCYRRHIVNTVAEAKTEGIFHNAQTIIFIRGLLRALSHPQLPTPIKTDNNASNSFVHNNIH